MIACLLLAGPLLNAAGPPATPQLLEPEEDGQLVSGADVHMVTSPFADPDGDGHLCTDWQIRLSEDVVWESLCATGAERVHTHLGDGNFAGPQARRHDLVEGLTYVLSARHRDDSGDSDHEWSAWAERTFKTSIPPASAPMSLRDVISSPSPQWTSTAAPGASLRLESLDRESFLQITSSGLQHETSLASRSAVRVVLTAGETPWDLVESDLTFEDENGKALTIYLPAVQLAAAAQLELWVSANGGTHRAQPGSRAPDFETILRGAPVPWSVRQRGFVVEPVAEGLQLPVNIAFVPNPSDEPDAPYYYVAELYGSVKVVTRAGDVRELASNLLDIEPTGHFPGNGESGLAGIAVDPQSGDVFVTGVYWPDRSIWSLDPRVLRLRVSEDGLRALAVETVVAFRNEHQSPSHQISNITFGPDGMLYVHLGDSAEHELAQDMTTIRGKILRMNVDGSAPPDNPFFDATDGISATDYIFALGFRNPFGGAWRAADQSLYSIENGPTTDRLARIVAGRNYQWDGTDDSMRTFAAHTWKSPAAPVQLAFVQRETFDGSGFPATKMGSAFVTESGPTWATGVQSAGKRITEVVLGEEQSISSAPLIEYDGTGKATAAAIAAGPDGLYFSDLYQDFGYEKTIDRGARVFRVRWTGYAAFGVRSSSADRQVVRFEDQSDVPEATTWNWDFGDGTFSSERSPRHTFTSDGPFLVRLSVTGPRGTLHETKRVWLGSVSSSLTAEYYTDTEFQNLAVRRDEPRAGFDWFEGDPLDPEKGFSARWTGTVRPRFSESFRFTVRSNDPVRVTVGGVVVVDAWTGTFGPETSATIDLEAGREYPILIEYRNLTRPAALEALWESETQPALHIPHSYPQEKRRASRH